MRRFYTPKNNFREKTITLDSDETRHLRNVLRLSEGEKIQVFDGEGHEFLCVIEKIEKRQTTLEIIEEISPNTPESDLDLTLAVSLTKGDKFDLVIQKSVELGVAKFAPIITKRCDVKLKNAERKLERWQKIIIESSKQCGRAKLMQIENPTNFQEFIKTSASLRLGGELSLLFSERNGENFSDIKSTKKITAVIGSEGGWEDSEIEFAKQNDFQIITLKGRILRAETAAISIAAILQNHFGDLN
jgi:16S rRNA (uracil1498-N3)-methyltransferase